MRCPFSDEMLPFVSLPSQRFGGIVFFGHVWLNRSRAKRASPIVRVQFMSSKTLNLRVDPFAMQPIWCILLLAVSANAATLTVKSGGGGNFTTIQACATAMAAGDTCVVYAGTYNEN